MTTPKDDERTAAFCAWLDLVGGMSAAHDLTGIQVRTLHRMVKADKVAPVSLLHQLAEHADDNGEIALAHRLRAAAAPARDNDHA